MYIYIYTAYYIYMHSNCLKKTHIFLKPRTKYCLLLPVIGRLHIPSYPLVLLIEPRVEYTVNSLVVVFLV